jgi:hypothetical protein
VAGYSSGIEACACLVERLQPNLKTPLQVIIVRKSKPAERRLIQNARQRRKIEKFRQMNDEPTQSPIQQQILIQIRFFRQNGEVGVRVEQTNKESRSASGWAANENRRWL